MGNDIVNPKQSKLMTKLRTISPDDSHFTVLDNGRVVPKHPYDKDALAEHLLLHALAGLTVEELPEELQWLKPRIPKTSWCSPACAARAFGLRICAEHLRLMKLRVGRASIGYLPKPYQLFTLKQYSKHGELEGWKFYDDTIEIDRVWAANQFEVARDRREKHLDKMEAIIFGGGEPDHRDDAPPAEAAPANP